MIALLALLGCAGPGGDTAAVAFLPEPGLYAVAFEQTYRGDCALANMDTTQPEASEWEIELESTGFTLYDETGYPLFCAWDSPDFSCSDGTYGVSYTESGYDAVEYVTVTTSGTFSEPTAFDAALAITAECDGEDCATIGTQYGEDFTYPCTAEAHFTGAHTE